MRKLTIFRQYASSLQSEETPPPVVSLGQLFHPARPTSQSTRPVYINGRFIAQPLSGVQRFATEMTIALLSMHPDQVVVLTPPNTSHDLIPTRSVGRLTGQLWEQLDLPRHTRGGLLINLGNTAPLLVPRQVVVMHDAGVFRVPEAYSWRFRLWYKFLQRRIGQTNAKLITVSQFSKAELCNVLQVIPESVALIPEGADHIHRIVRDDTILTDYSLIPGKFVIAVGNLSVHKNLFALSVLATRLKARGLILAVAGSCGSAFLKGSSLRLLPQPALYLGRVTDAELKALYSAAACFVFPSRYEGFGLPAIEAMASGCPVVVADIPALRETCGDAVLYCDPSSPDNIACEVIRLLENPKLAEQLKVRSLSHVQQMTWTRAASALYEISTSDQ